MINSPDMLVDQVEDDIERQQQPLLQLDQELSTTGDDESKKNEARRSLRPRGDRCGQRQPLSKRILVSSVVIIGCLIPFILWFRLSSSHLTELQRIGPSPFLTHSAMTTGELSTLAMCQTNQTNQATIDQHTLRQPPPSTSATDDDQLLMSENVPPAAKLNSNTPSTHVYPSIETCQPFIDSDDSESNGSFNSSDRFLGRYPSPANLRDLWRLDGVIPDEQLTIRAEQPFFWIEPKLLHKTTSTMTTPGKVDPINAHRQPNMIVRVGERFTVHLRTNFHRSDLCESDGTPIKLTLLKGIYVWFYAHPHFMVAADMVDGPTADELVRASLPASLSATGMITLNFTFSALIPDVEWYECLIILRGTSQFWHLGGDEGYTVQVVDDTENEAARTTLSILQRLSSESMDDLSAISHVLSTLTLPIPQPHLCDSDSSTSPHSRSSLSRYLPITECHSWNRIDPVGGRWVACHLLGPSRLQHCLRDGWLYVPSNCYYTVYDSTSMNTLPIWIVWAGSSILRGNFLTQVDLMLQHRASTIGQSDFWKCWGWMDLQVDKYRISYLDFRWDFWLYDNATGVAFADPTTRIDPNYVSDARSFLRLLTDPSQASRLSQKEPDVADFISTRDGTDIMWESLIPAVPDVIIFESPSFFKTVPLYEVDHSPVGNFMWPISVVDSMVHPDWAGRKIVIPVKMHLHWTQPHWNRMSPMIDRYLSSLTTSSQLKSSWEMVSDSASLHVLHTHESFSRACHPHDRCNENGKHVCSIADEMTVTMLLNDIIKSNRTGSQQLRSRMSTSLHTPVFKSHSPHPPIRPRTRTPSPRPDCSLIFPKGGSSPAAQTRRVDANQLHFCTHCPVDLVPFRISSADVIHPQCRRELYQVPETSNETATPSTISTYIIIATLMLMFIIIIIGALKFKWAIVPFARGRW